MERRIGSSAANAWTDRGDRIDLTRARPEPRPLRLAASPQDVILDLARTAILVVDMQNDFLSPGGWFAARGIDASGAAAATRSLQGLLPVLRGAGIPVVWVNWGNRPDRANLNPTVLHSADPAGAGPGYGARLAPDGDPVLEKDSWGAAVVDGLAIEPGDVQVDKFRLSGFWDNELDSILRNLRVTTLLFAGVNVDRCVLATLQDASFLGYDCLLLEDCSATTAAPPAGEAACELVRRMYGFVIRGADLEAGLSG
jgi:nicotinamidase-related amidase